MDSVIDRFIYGVKQGIFETELDVNCMHSISSIIYKSVLLDLCEDDDCNRYRVSDLLYNNRFGLTYVSHREIDDKIEFNFVISESDYKLFIDNNVNDNAVEPSHYTDMKLSPLEYIEANNGEFSWCIANVIKYVSRYKRKNGIEDLKKAAWYLDYEIKKLEEKENE